MAEDGPISSRYPLTELSGGYRQRTKQNVIDADGTVIFYRSYLQGGTEATVLFCIKQKKPYKLIDIELVAPETATELLGDFICNFHIETLNVAGPRASTCPDIYNYVKQVITQVIQSA